MKKYAWRNTVTATVSKQQSHIRGKLAFKTQNTSWLNTQDPVVVLVSIQSQFHNDVSGDLKMNALMSTIKSHTRGKVTVLLAERAHLHAASLDHQGDEQKAYRQILSDAQTLKERYTNYFLGCNVVLWHSYIYEDKTFAQAYTQIEALYIDDPLFKAHLLSDAKDQTDATIQDLLEQCACILVLASKGYRFQFYPGSPCACTEYLKTQVSWIDVFLSIEKKTESSVVFS